jgi:hypothetical protein
MITNTLAYYNHVKVRLEKSFIISASEFEKQERGEGKGKPLPTWWWKNGRKMRLTNFRCNNKLERWFLEQGRLLVEKDVPHFPFSLVWY